MRRNNNLDLLRILACFGVIGLHSFDQSIGMLNRVVYLFCGLSVPIFFMISGYTMLAKESVSVKYSMNKIIALVRIVILWDVVKYIFYTFLSIRYNNFGSWLIGGFIKDAWQGLIQEGTHWHFWYLGTLMIIYLVLPILNKICKNNRVLIALWVVLFVASGTIQIMSYVRGESLQRHVYQTFRLWTAFQYLLLGGIISRFQNTLHVSKDEDNSNDKKDKLFFVLPISYIMLTIVWIIIQNTIIENGNCEVWAECYYDDFIAIAWNCLLFIIVMKINLSEKISVIIEKLAPLTFGIYLVHPIILATQSKYIHATSFSLSVVQYVILAVASLISTYVLSRYIPKLVKL